VNISKFGPKRIDITGIKFNNLTAIRYIENRGKNSKAYWLFKCVCGKEVVLRCSAVKTGVTKSCGCSRRKDIAGKKFNMLTAIKFSHRKNKNTYWLFKCVCGNIKKIDYGSVKNGSTKSCGCISLSINHGMSKTSIYSSWQSMRDRCLNKNNKQYKDYGGRGIKICDRWERFQVFCEDMGIKPLGTTIERLDNNGGYNKDNCAWATPKEQSRNTRANVTIKYKGERKCISEWAELYNIKRCTLGGRLRLGWGIHRALNEPVGGRKS